MTQRIIETLKIVIGITDINSPKGKYELIKNHNVIESTFYEWECEFIEDPETLNRISECHTFVENLYNIIISNYLREFANSLKSGASIDFIINTYKQDEIAIALDKYLTSKGLPEEFIIDVYIKLKERAERLDKKFSFDEVTLIHLIEASSGKNIIHDSGKKEEYIGKVLASSDKGYKLKESDFIEKYTRDSSVIEVGPRPFEGIEIRDYPLGNMFYNEQNAMRNVMEILFENLNLCLETYSSIYTKETNVIENQAKLTDGTTFIFSLLLSDYNIPHLLGIKPASAMDPRAIDFINLLAGETALTETSSALKVLTVLIKYQNKIIEANGLYEIEGRKYELFNWEKIILKTTSFMRGDFFKTCFCLAKIRDDKYLTSPDKMGGYATISTTEFNKGLNSSMSKGELLKELLSEQRMRKEYIFRGLVKDQNRGKEVHVPYTIMTGKGETIHYGNRNEILTTLQRFRELFLSDRISVGKTDGTGEKAFSRESVFASIVQEVENESYIKKFSVEEQAVLAKSVQSDLGLEPVVTKEMGEIMTLTNGELSKKINEELGFESTNPLEHKENIEILDFMKTNQSKRR